MIEELHFCQRCSALSQLHFEITYFLYDSAAHAAAGLFMVPLSTLCSMLPEEASSHLLIYNNFLC